MWLINVANRQLELHNDERTLPRYAILSHTWSGTEVSMQEYRMFVADGCVTSQKGPSTPGLSEIEACCVQADKDKLSHLWIDTCCIDKTSSAGLSEAINSMFRCYKNAEICYVHLEDINASVLEGMPVDTKLLSQARWFTRGWTLQGLIAPQSMVFFDGNWMRICTKVDRIDSLALITGAEQAYLTGADLSKASIAKRMYWAAGRVTTKVEDMAYSLLGLFDINMPLLYGEGAKAFFRLQEEILKETDDQSLFAWEPKLTHSGQVQHLRKVTLSEGIPVFAHHPAEF